MAVRAAVLAGALAVLAACDAGDRGYAGRRDPHTLVVAQASDVISLDPVRITDAESIDVGQQMFEGLVLWKPGTTETVPGLAIAWEVSADGLHWTFHLRPNVTFHDGTPFDAAAVVFSYQRLLDPHHPFFRADGSYWRGMLHGVTAVTAADPLTVRMDISSPYAPLLGNLAMLPIVSPTAVARWGDAFGQHPVGTGPFAFDDWRPGEQVVVHRFADYWGTPPWMDRVVFEVVVDARQRLIDLEAGSVDLASAILPDEQPFVQLHPDMVLHHVLGNNVSYLAFNTQKPPFDDPRVRRAASMAINRDPIVKLAYEGRAVAADGPLPPSQWGYHPPAVRYPYDPVAARALLGEAIAAGTFDPAQTFKLYAPTTPRPYLAQPERVARFLQAALEQVGIHTELVLQPSPLHSAAIERGDHDLCLYGWIGDTGDPDNFLYVLFDSDNAVAGEAQNVAFYRERSVDALLVQAQMASDQHTRTALYAEVQDKLAVDAPWVPIAHGELVVAARVELAGVVLNPTGQPLYSLIRRAEPR